MKEGLISSAQSTVSFMTSSRSSVLEVSSVREGSLTDRAMIKDFFAMRRARGSVYGLVSIVGAVTLGRLVSGGLVRLVFGMVSVMVFSIEAAHDIKLPECAIVCLVTEAEAIVLTSGTTVLLSSRATAEIGFCVTKCRLREVEAILLSLRAMTKWILSLIDC